MSELWQPAHDRHAIEAVAFILTFSSDFPPLLMQKLRDRARELATASGLVSERTTVDVSTAPDGSEVETETGVLFVSTDDLPEAAIEAGHFVEMLAIDEDSIGYRISKYESWTASKSRFFHFINDLLPLLRDVMAVSKIRLEYSDRFFWNGSWPDLNVDGLLRPNSKHFAPHIFERRGSWHSHTGAVLTAREDQVTRMLQIYLQSGNWRNSFDGSVRSGVTLMSGREDRFDVSDVENASYAYDILQSEVEQMHADLIQAAEEVLADSMLDKINLREAN